MLVVSSNSVNVTALKPFTEYAAGEVDNVYPVPVQADSMLDLALFEALDKESATATIFVTSKFKTGANVEKPQYIGWSVGDKTEDTISNAANVTYYDMSNCTSWSITERYRVALINTLKAPTYTDLITKMAGFGVAGTVCVQFYNKEREVIKQFKIVI